MAVVGPLVARTAVSEHLLDEQEVMVITVVDAWVTVVSAPTGEVVSDPTGEVVSDATGEKVAMGTAAVVELDVATTPEVELEVEFEDTSGSLTSTEKPWTESPLNDLMWATKSEISSLLLMTWERNLLFKEEVELAAGVLLSWTWKNPKLPLLKRSLAGTRIALPASAMSFQNLTPLDT